MKSRKLPFALVIAAVILGIGAWRLLRAKSPGVDASEASPAASTPAPQASTLPPTEAPTAPDVKIHGNAAKPFVADAKDAEFPFKASEEAKAAIGRCLPTAKIGATDPVGDAWNAIQQSAGGSRDEQLTLENIHAVQGDGRLLRLHIVPDERGENPQQPLMLRLFSEDDEHLPVPEPYPEEIRGQSLTEAVAHLTDNRVVAFHEYERMIGLADGSRWRVTVQNGRVRSVMPGGPFGNGKLLMCDTDFDKSSIECSCH